MQLDSVLVRITSIDDARRLARHGGEMWQHTLWRVSAEEALRLGLVVLGPELGETGSDAHVPTPPGTGAALRPGAPSAQVAKIVPVRVPPPALVPTAGQQRRKRQNQRRRAG